MFKQKTSAEGIDLVQKVLVYDPLKRLTPIDALLHPFFDELRVESTRLPNGHVLPDLFRFVKEEIRSTTP